MQPPAKNLPPAKNSKSPRGFLTRPLLRADKYKNKISRGLLWGKPPFDML